MSASILALALCFSGIFCLTPLAIFLLHMANLNRRTRPTVVSGVWDFLTLVGGLLGFLICGGLITLTALLSNIRYWTRGNFEQLREAWIVEGNIWIASALVYLLIIVGAIVFVSYRRRRTLSVYAIDLESALETIDSEIQDIVGPKPCRRMGYEWPSMVSLKPFVGLGHIILKIQATDPKQADEIDLRMRRALPHASAPSQNISSWLSTSAIACGIGAIFSFALILIYIYFVQSR